jgi:hypothetical protein
MRGKLTDMMESMGKTFRTDKGKTIRAAEDMVKGKESAYGISVPSRDKYAKGGQLKKSQKRKILGAVMAAHVAGIQKGRAAGAAPPPPAGGPPMGPGGPPMAPPAGGPPMGMKKGGKVLPPWLKAGKVKKMAVGGRVTKGRGDGCAMRGGTRGRMV